MRKTTGTEVVPVLVQMSAAVDSKLCAEKICNVDVFDLPELSARIMWMIYRLSRMQNKLFILLLLNKYLK